MTMSSTLTRQFALATGALAIVGMGALSACSSDTKEKPAETTAPSQSSSAPNAPAPTEKAVGGGANSFSPTVTARPAPTALPGNVVTGG
jgi:hypothetical protein